MDMNNEIPNGKEHRNEEKSPNMKKIILTNNFASRS